MKRIGQIRSGSIEESCNYRIQERKRYDGDDAQLAALWKILLPVVRVGPLLPSQEMQWIPSVQPNCTAVDIKAFTIRPPAVAIVEKTRVKKHHMNLEGDVPSVQGGRFDERMAGAQRAYASLAPTKILLAEKERRG
jgi:hypothetical protein